jgi:hypothetical protein
LRANAGFQMSELPRSDQDMAFARGLAEEYREQFFDVDRVQRFGVSANRDAANLLSSLELQVSRYIGSPPSFLPAYLRRLLEWEIALALRLLAAGQGGVLVLKQAGNGFGLDVIVDIFNESARRALSSWSTRALDDRDDGSAAPPPPGPPLNPEWIDNVRRGQAPVRLVSAQEGSASFLTLFSDALRISASASSANPPQVYTANCNLKGWILEIWQQFNYSPTRFGNKVTWPVTDTLPTSGNYMFQGLKGASVRKDATPHYLGPSRTQTLVKL